ncbi:protein phosphatase 2C-like domain-containing protein 1 [Hypanus sabinus]|uniref:protein phosphatase 2C-like domain-containing protein 1 n=1 Tax=Hypanus sabinus TaxID=79690 RepID=UPI0028C381A7|nr:protein phosphatase 2C-like domain-containing protein 1 [Hypanus sabinus]
MIPPPRENLPSVSRIRQAPPQSQCAKVPCLICDHELHAQYVRHHRVWHRALSTLQYHKAKSPVSLLALRIRRRGIISKAAKSKRWSSLKLEKIDYAYELVKSHRMSTWPILLEKSILCTMEPPLSLRMPRKNCTKAFGVCQDMNAPWKSQMEDIYVFIDCYGGRSNSWFIGLFNGFHGSTAAQFTSKDLPLLILQQLALAGHPYELSEEEHTYLFQYNVLFPQGTAEKSLTEPTYAAATARKGSIDRLYGSVHMAFAKAFWKMDRILRLGRNERSKVRWSGCTATTCLLEPSVSQIPNTTEVNEDRVGAQSENNSCENGTLHIANAGDVQAVLCKNGKSYRLNGNHSTSNSKERKRILHAGGTISKNQQHGLVEGITQSTRGLGYHGDPKLKTSIIPIPYTASIPIDSSCQFIILASSGFWKVLNRHEVVSITLQMLSFYFGSSHTNVKEIHTLHVMDHSKRHIDLGSSLIYLLDEFSEQGYNDAVISTEHLFEELLGKKYAIKRDHVERLLMQYSLKDVNSTVKHALDNLMENIIKQEESKSVIKHVTDEFPVMAEHSSNISVEDLLHNSSSKELGTMVSNFQKKPLSEMEVKDRVTLENSTGETSEEEYIADRTSVVTFAEDLKANEELNDHYSQENITNNTKPNTGSMSSIQIEISLSETEAVIERPYDEAYTTNQNTEATSQETAKEIEVFQHETIAKTISERLVQTAKLAGACDNLTVMILLLPGCTKTLSLAEQQQ